MILVLLKDAVPETCKGCRWAGWGWNGSPIGRGNEWCLLFDKRRPNYNPISRCKGARRAARMEARNEG